MKYYVSPDLYDKILSTYPDSNINNIWKSFFIMAELFHDLASEIAQTMSFNYNTDEEQKVTRYLKWICKITAEE